MKQWIFSKEKITWTCTRLLFYNKLNMIIRNQSAGGRPTCTTGFLTLTTGEPNVDHLVNSVFNVFISVVHFELLSIQPMLQGLQSECSEQRWFVFLHSQRNQSSAGNTWRTAVSLTNAAPLISVLWSPCSLCWPVDRGQRLMFPEVSHTSSSAREEQQLDVYLTHSGWDEPWSQSDTFRGESPRSTLAL